MSDATPTVATETIPTLDKGAYVIQKKSFTGEKKGFSFHIVQFKNETDVEANASIEAMKTRWGADSVVTLVNTAIASSLRTKASNSLDIVQNDDSHKTRTKQNWQKLLDAGKDVLLTESEAEAYVPGEREKTISGIMKQVKELMAKGDIASLKEAMALTVKVQELIEEKSILEAGDNTSTE